MAEDTTVVRVTADNFGRFLDLVDRLARYEKLEAPDVEARERLRRDCLSDRPPFEAYLGLVSGEPVAYSILLTTYSSFLARPTLHMEDIFVLEEHRGRGVGRAMFAHARELASCKGCARMEWMVLKWNESAQRFYERMGAERLEWYFYRLDMG